MIISNDTLSQLLQRRIVLPQCLVRDLYFVIMTTPWFMSLIHDPALRIETVIQVHDHDSKSRFTILVFEHDPRSWFDIM